MPQTEGTWAQPGKYQVAPCFPNGTVRAEARVRGALPGHRPMDAELVLLTHPGEDTGTGASCTKATRHGGWNTGR